MTNLFDLTEKVAIVTGAAGGVGSEIAQALAIYGANLALLDKRREKLEVVAQQISLSGHKAFSAQCDVTKEAEVQAAVKAVLDRFGQIDILINNAGVASVGSVEEIVESEWDRGQVSYDPFHIES